MMTDIGITGVRVPAQVTIVVLILTFVALIVYVAILPTMLSFIEPTAQQLEQSGDQLTATMLRLFPFIILIGIILAFVWYIMPRYG